MYKSTVVYADVTAITASANYGVAELQYESMMDNKVNFYEMPWMQLNSYPQKGNPEREALIIFVSIAVGNFLTNMQSIEVIVMMW